MAEWLESYLRLILERFHPERRILFGSCVYGQPDRHSDFERLIIRRNIPSKKTSNPENAEVFWDAPGSRSSFTIWSKAPGRITNRLVVKMTNNAMESPSIRSGGSEVAGRRLNSNV